MGEKERTREVIFPCAGRGGEGWGEIRGLKTQANTRQEAGAQQLSARGSWDASSQLSCCRHAGWCGHGQGHMAAAWRGQGGRGSLSSSVPISMTSVGRGGTAGGSCSTICSELHTPGPLCLRLPRQVGARPPAPLEWRDRARALPPTKKSLEKEREGWGESWRAGAGRRQYPSTQPVFTECCQHVIWFIAVCTEGRGRKKKRRKAQSTPNLPHSSRGFWTQELHHFAV